MLDDFEGDDEVEACVRERKLRGAGGLEQDVGTVEVPRRVGDGVAVTIDRGDVQSRVGQLRRTITGAAPDIQHALATRQASGKGVAGEMFVPQIRIDFARNDALPGEFVT